MAFNLFGKSSVADLIIVNGQIYTQNPEDPWVSGVACKDGKVLAVGSRQEVEKFQGKSTEVLDLMEHFMTPGLIDAYGTPVLDVFRQCCIFLDEDQSIDEVLQTLGAQLGNDSGQDTFFAFGYGSNLLKDLSAKEATSLLDQVESTRTVLLLSKDGYGAWLNTPAMSMVQEAADEEAMEIITLPFTISVLNPFSYDVIQKAVVFQAWDYAAKGIAGLYNSGSPDVFDNIYQNVLVAMDQEGLLAQRHFGALTISSKINPEFVAHKLVENRIKCIELEELINFDTLKLQVNPSTLQAFDEKYIQNVILAALERGFNVEVDAQGRESVLATYQALSQLKVPVGQKSTILVAASEELGDEEKGSFILPANVVETTLVPPRESRAAAILEAMTLGSADKLGILDRLGTIEVGKYADFTIFESNPLEGNGLPQVSMTLVAGDVVYDKAEDQPEEWNRLVSQQNEFDGEETDRFEEE